MSDLLSWGSIALEFRFEWNDDSPVRVSQVTTGGRAHPVHRVPLVEILTVAQGSLPASDRLAHTELGSLLRYAGHELAGDRLVIRQVGGGVEASIELEAFAAAPSAIRSSVTVRAVGSEPVVLRAVASWTAGFTVPADAGATGKGEIDATATDATETDTTETDAGAPDTIASRRNRSDAFDALDGWERISGTSDWLGEGRWSRESLRGPDFPELAEGLTGHDPRGAWAVTSDGTWSTGRRLPVGGVESIEAGLAILWQVEHNGAWRWEIAEDTDGGYFSLSGPTDTDSAWTHVLAPGESFTTVPVAIALGADFTQALAALTDLRRATRRPHPDNEAMPVVFNDYMNTLDGDPTTEKLLPLIAAAAEVGSEIFCIDAGWYDDSGHWWDTVGEWEPSTTRFPGGLGEVIDAIRAAGMTPGLWLEPEVIGVRSPMADRLPREAFLLRHGQRIVEHHRYHLDLRHPAAVEHLDGVVDRLVRDFGVGFFKFDYNINPGAGTDHDADSVGDGLLEHNRAHLAWLDALLDRHPGLVIENCSSGAMRMDFAMMSRLAMQSTSDQQDFTKFPPIAAAAPVSLLPEQAANWAYPQPGMSEEEVAFCLVTGLLGRFYVSGYLNRMDAPRRALVAEAVAVAKSLRTDIRSGHAHWPSGLPGWGDPWVSLALRSEHDDLVSVWRRDGSTSTELAFPHLMGEDVHVTTVFPTELPAWQTAWDAATGTLTVRANDDELAARTLRLTTDIPSRAQRTASQPVTGPTGRIG